MSAIADIIVNQSNPANLQLSQNIIDSQPLNSTTSFADVLNQYKAADVDAGKEEPESQPVVKTEETSKQNVTEDSKNEEKNEVTESEKVDVKEKTETKTAKADENSKETVKSEAENKEIKVSVEDSKKSVKNTDAKTVKTEKKAADIEKDNLQYFEEYTASLMNKNVSDNNEIKENDSKKSEIKVELKSNTEIPLENQIAVTKTDTDQEMNFADLLKDESKAGKNELKLDKEGKITVQDLRTKVAEETVSEEPKLKTQVKITSDSTATITMNYAEETVQADVLSLNNQSAAADGSTFQTMLNNQIQANVPEFVKAGNIILKDNNQGTINLVLHPDDLGNVKIQLSVDGKSLTGHITVATKEALQVFKDNSETLREAFIKNGFDAANFEVSYGNSGNSNQNFAFEQQNDGTNLLGRNIYNSVGAVAEVESTGISEITENFGNYSVNIVA